MKKLSLILVLFSLFFIACEDDSENAIIPDDNQIISQIEALPFESLSFNEEAALLFMREEEKLARDIYDYLYLKWSIKSFNNISNSEQKHMDAVLALLKKYNLQDPVAEDVSGIFVNKDLQNLYNSLIEEGEKNREEALRVGAAIEEIDIIDLQIALENNVDNQDISIVFENLIKGSRNHLRAFVKNLNSYGITYMPVYLDQALYNSIISSDIEKGAN